MANEDKTEEATPKKRQDERKKGNVFQSRDLTTALFIFVAFYSLEALFPYMSQKVSDCMVYFITLGGEIHSLDVRDAGHLLGIVGKAAFSAVAPILAITLLTNIAITMAQTKLLFTLENLKFKLSKLNPLKGLKRMISLRAVVDLVKSLLKVIIIAALVVTSIQGTFLQLPRVMDMSASEAGQFAGDEIMGLVMKIGLVFLGIAVFDFFYQRWDHEKNMKMSKHEIKQEYKQMEGDPQIKGKRKELQQKAAMHRMMQQVPEADVVVRNPTHFAVALKYTDQISSAPIVLAKGQDFVALKIVEMAEINNIPMLENPVLARGLYHSVDIGQEILPEHYQAVAEVFAWVYRLNKRN